VPQHHPAAARPGSRPRRRALAAASAAVACALLAGPATAQDEPQPVAGASSTNDAVVVEPAAEVGRTEVALQISRATFADDEVDRVLLATEAAFADALASGTLQGTDSPLLLTPPDELPADVAGEIDRLGASEVVILGGVQAVAPAVEESLVEAGLDVRRIAGGSRVETAAAVAAEAPDHSTAIVARGFGSAGDDTQAFADSLAAGAWAAEQGWPILLTTPDVLAPATAAAVQDLGVERVLLLGGEAAIAPQVEAELEALGVDVDRVAGTTRVDTAVAVARERGFDDEADADRVILVEGQAPDAWAAGFAAAAHAARVPAPVLLASGPELPESTAAFLRGEDDPELAVEEEDVTEPVLVCAADPAACEEARVLLGLPPVTPIGLLGADRPIPSRSTLEGVAEVEDPDARLAVLGDCVTEGLLVPDQDGRIAIEVRSEPGPCEVTFELRHPNGTVQTTTYRLAVAAALPSTGTVVDTETGGDAYAYTPDGGDAVVTVDYDAGDAFTVDGEPATIGAFEAALTVADRVTFTADTDDGDVHELVDVDPEAVSEGTVGDVDLSAGTFAIIEPVSGVVLRGGLQLADVTTFTVGGEAADRAAVEEALNEGDLVQVVGATLRLTDQLVRGAAQDVAVDVISGVARFRVDGLGDDPRNPEDDRFRAVAGAEDQAYRVDGVAAGFATFADALSEGDEITYRRTGGIERIDLVNAPRPAVEGLVTETADPDGSAVAPEPEDGGSVVVLTSDGRVEVAYGPDAVIRIDGALATEEELEAARTPGDLLLHQPADPGTGTRETLRLTNRDLVGEVADVSEGGDRYDVVVRAGVVYEDLVYTAGIFGGPDRYVIDGDVVGLAQFETELALVDRGELVGTIVVRATDEGTEHRLTVEDREG
jgi:putative cell wall-binding protein